MDIERVVVRLLADATQYQRVMRGAETELTGFVNRTTSMGGAISLPFIAAASAVTAFGVALAGASAYAVQAATSFEVASISIEVMVGDAKVARDLVKQINQMAIETPFKSPELIAGAKQLGAYGVIAKDMMATLQALGNVSSGTNTPMERIILAFGQIKVAGRLMGPELRQLVDAGIPMFKYLAKVMNESESAIKELVQEGKVGFPLVVKAFNEMTKAGGLYGGLMDRINKETISGRWSSFVETIQINLRDMATAFFKGFRLGELIDEMADFFQSIKMTDEEVVVFSSDLRAGFEMIRTFAREVRDWVKENQELLLNILKVTGILLGLAAAVAMTRIALGLLLVPIGLMTIGIQALIPIVGFLALGFMAFEDIPKTFGEISEWWEKLTKDSEQFQSTLKKIGGAVVGLIALFGIWRASMIALSLVMIAVQAAGLIIAGLGTALSWLLAIGPAILPLVGIGLAFKLMYDNIKELPGLLRDLQSDIGDFFSWVGDSIASLFKGFGDYFKKLGGDLIFTFKGAFEGISAAINSGDLKLAAEIAFKGIEVAFRQTIVALKKEWEQFTYNIQTSEANRARDKMATGLAVMGAAGLSVPEQLKEGLAAGVRIAGLRTVDLMEGLGIIGPEQANKSRQTTYEQMRKAAEDAKISPDLIKGVIDDYWETQKNIQALHEGSLKALDDSIKPYQKQLDDLINKSKEPAARQATYESLIKEIGEFTSIVNQIDSRYLDKMTRLRTRNAEIGRELNRLDQGPGGDARRSVLGTERVNIYNEMDIITGQLPGMKKMAQAELSKMKDKFKSMGFVDPMDIVAGGFQAMMGGLKKQGGGYGQMRVPYAIDIEAVTLAGDIKREMEKELKGGIGFGAGQFTHFGKQQYLLNQAVLGYRPGEEQQALAEAALTGGQVKGVINKEQYGFAAYRNFDNLRRWVEKQQEQPFPKAMLRGSAEAQDVINRQEAMGTRLTLEEQIRDIMERGQQIEKDELKVMENIRDILERIEGERTGLEGALKRPDFAFKSEFIPG